MKRYVDRETTHKILTIVFVKGHMVILTVLWTRKLLGLLGQLLHRAEIESRDRNSVLEPISVLRAAPAYQQNITLHCGFVLRNPE